MKNICGLTAVFLGIAAADTENLIIPLTLLVIGFWLLRKEICR